MSNAVGPSKGSNPPDSTKQSASRSNTSNRDVSSGSTSIWAIVLTTLCYIYIIIFPIQICCLIKIVQEYERAVIFRWGHLRSGKARGPGTFFILPFADVYINVDLRTVSYDIPPQEILTKDSVTAKVDAVVYYRVAEPLLAIVKVQDYRLATQLLAQTQLRDVLGTRTLSEILSDRDSIGRNLHIALDEATDPWGIKVERVEITDVKLPQQLQRAMAAEAEATREARAKVIAAEGEMKAARSLKEAAQVLLESPASLQLRYLQTLTTVAAEKNTTYIFPFPMELLGRR